MTTANTPSTEEVVPAADATPVVDADEAAWNAEVARREAVAAGEDPPPEVKETPQTPEPQPSAGVPASAAPNAAEAPKPSVDDVLAKIPESERAAVKAMLDAEKTERERIAAERQELEHKFRSAQGRITAMEKKGAAPGAAQQPSKRPPDAQLEARRKQFKEDYPEVAEMIDSLREELSANTLPADSKEFIEEQRRKTAINQKVDAVATVHKDFVPLVKSQEFDTWAIKQPEPIKRLISSDDPEDVIAAMDIFKVAHPHLKASPSPSASTDAGNPSTDSPEQVALRKKREAQSRAVELPANGGTLPQQLDEASEDALWRQAAAAADKRLAARR